MYSWADLLVFALAQYRAQNNFAYFSSELFDVGYLKG